MTMLHASGPLPDVRGGQGWVTLFQWRVMSRLTRVWLAALVMVGIELLGAPATPAVTIVNIRPDKPTCIRFPAVEARFVRMVLGESDQGEPCIDEWEIYGAVGDRNLALAANGAKATASSCLPGHAIHQVAHLNDGLYGNSHSWISATSGEEWAQIELPQTMPVARVEFSRDREGKYGDRLPVQVEVRVSVDGTEWRTVAAVRTAGAAPPLVRMPTPLTWDGLLEFAFTWEKETWALAQASDPFSPLALDRPAEPDGPPYWAEIVRLDAVSRTLRLMQDLIGRLAKQGLDVSAEQTQLDAFRRRQASIKDSTDSQADEQALFLDARRAKRHLMLRDPRLSCLQRLLFVKRHPLEPSHNYSDYLDSSFRGGGAVCTLQIPSRGGRLVPEDGIVTTLFDARDGIARDPVADYEGQRIYFAYRPAGNKQTAYWHLMAMNADGSEVTPLTDGPYHDYYPCPLPDGGLCFVTTRCECRFLCWVPMACVLFRMNADGSGMRPLSFANLSEWGPSVTRDGRILWTRSEYLDKGANFGHTLWTIHPDGTHPELLYGNNTRNCSMNGHEVPETDEVSAVLISHFGDFNGPIGLIDRRKGKFNPEAVTSITPDVSYHYDAGWPARRCFRDPLPIGRDYFLVSHAPSNRKQDPSDWFGLYLIDRYGNRELLYLDPAIGSMAPSPLAPRSRPPAPSSTLAEDRDALDGDFFVADVYEGLGPEVRRGTAKYLRVSAEVRSGLERMPSGALKEEYTDFTEYYAAPCVGLPGSANATGPHGWPSFVAKAVYGIADVGPDGSAHFRAPAGIPLYFQLLDGDFNEIQRMRSLVQLQPGETRGCIGCHEDRARASARVGRPAATLRVAAKLQPPPWGAGAFSYQTTVQPVLDAHCVRCHDSHHEKKLDLTATLDSYRVPASYRTLISAGCVHYFDMSWGRHHEKARPLSFGTVQSKIVRTLEAGHNDVTLTGPEMQAIKCWIDLNCPLWPDYRHRLTRPEVAQSKP